MIETLQNRVPMALCLTGLLILSGCAGEETDTASATAAAQTETQEQQNATNDGKNEAGFQHDSAANGAAEDQRAQRAREARQQRERSAELEDGERVDRQAGFTVIAEPDVLDFGEMATGETKRGTITLTNTGDTPRRINDSRSSCGCTVANVPRGEYLDPGESVEIEVSLRASNRPEQLSKTVTVLVDGQPPLRVTVKGNAMSYVSMEPDAIDRDRMPDGRMVIRADDGEPFRILTVQPMIVQDLPQEADTEHEIFIDWDKWDELGQSRRVVIRLDHPKTQHLRPVIRVAAPRRDDPRQPSTRATRDQWSPADAPRLVTQGNLRAINELLTKEDEEEALDPNATDNQGRTLLAIAARAGDESMLEMLLRHGAAVDAPDRNGHTPLIHAVRARSIESARVLIAAGADVNVRDETLGNTPLSWAAGFSTSEIVREILNTDAEIDLEVRSKGTGNTPLIWAATFGQPESVQMLIDAGADIEAIDEAPGQGLTPIMHAARNGRHENLRVLINAGAELEKRDAGGRTPLIVAARATGATPETIQTLLEAGADVAATDEEGQTALDHARERRDRNAAAIVEILENATQG